MAFPTGWGRKVAITVDNTKVDGSGSHSDFAALITKDNIPTESIDAGSNSALNGGGDIRFSSDSAGTTQLACEVVTFVTNATAGSRKCEIWVKIPSLATGSDTTVYMWYKKAAETQPAVTNTYGRNAVWSDWEAVLHLDDSGYTDSTGNGYDGSLTTGSSQSFVSTSHPYGGTWADFTQAEVVTLTGSGSAITSTDITMLVWTDIDSAGPSQGLIGNRYDSPDTHWAQLQASGRAFAKDGSSEDLASVTASTGVHLMGLTHDGSDVRSYRDGSDVGNAASPLTIAYSADFRIGTYYDNISSRRYNGRAGAARIRNGALSADHISTIYNNEYSASTFASAGTAESAGGGGAYSIAGSTSVSATPSGTLDYSLNAGITGSTACSFAPAAALAYASGYTIVGDVSHSWSPSAALDHTQNASLSGSVSVIALPSSSLAYSSHYAVSGASSVSMLPAASLDYSSSAAITGDISYALAPTGTLSYTRNASLAGAVVYQFNNLAVMSYIDSSLVTPSSRTCSVSAVGRVCTQGPGGRSQKVSGLSRTNVI